MSKQSQRAKLILNPKDAQFLKQKANSLTTDVRYNMRAKLLLAYAASASVTLAAQAGDCTRPVAYKWIDRALSLGVRDGIKDKYHCPKPAVITKEAEAWVVSVACIKPCELGYAAELWSYRALGEHIRKHAVEKGHVCLLKAAKATVWRILNKNEIKPHKMRYYLEKRDPEFDDKMAKVLLYYEEVAVELNAAKQAEEKGESYELGRDIVTVSVDEKPGVQAIENTSPDLPPVAGKHPALARDYEYKRHGTLSILLALDLLTGHLIARVEDKHRSKEFVELLKDLDKYYATGKIIRVILDNHSAHISKETKGWLAQHPGRFQFEHTPKHGSWLNIVETVFGKMARTFLKGIRVNSKAELKRRILLGIKEINETPVIHRWNEKKKVPIATAADCTSN